MPKIGKIMVDKSKNYKDVSHEYTELQISAPVRYAKIENVGLFMSKFAINGFRIFGKGEGKKPEMIKKFVLL